MVVGFARCVCAVRVGGIGGFGGALSAASRSSATWGGATVWHVYCTAPEGVVVGGGWGMAVLVGFARCVCAVREGGEWW